MLFTTQHFNCIIVLSFPYTDDRKGVISMELHISFVVSIMASIIAYYICKWLDGKR